MVLVGYSANDPPMRYLLNSVAADGTRFKDLRERFAFVGGSGASDSVEMEDWKGRGITPIPYDEADNHLALGKTLERWSALSAINGKKGLVDAEIKRIVRQKWSAATDADRDLLDHLFRRSDSKERDRLSSLASEQKADYRWLEVIVAVAKEPVRESP